MWNLNTANFTKDAGKVFSCFSCGGGSTMGYKLAGFDVIGFNEIDQKLADTYIKNHNPKYGFVKSIVDFSKQESFPAELYNLDILDASPPCSVFTSAGLRDAKWGVEHKFREGQVSQVLDTLFFDTIHLVSKLKPKIFLAENVPGLLFKNASHYVDRIYKELIDAGYYVQHHLLDSSKMGVPQKRLRVFFIAIRNDIAKFHLTLTNLFDENVKLDLHFNEKEILYKEIREDVVGPVAAITPSHLVSWKICPAGKPLHTVHPRGSGFTARKLALDKVVPTVLASSKLFDEIVPRSLTKTEIILASSFPLDYDFGKNKAEYICGMSVPPLMIANIATRLKFLLE